MINRLRQWIPSVSVHIAPIDLRISVAMADHRAKMAGQCCHEKVPHLTASDSAETIPQALTKELLDYLRVCDLEFKPDLAAKVCQLIQRYSPERRWYIDSMLQVRTGMTVHAQAY